VTPPLDDDLRLAQRIEDLAFVEFVAKAREKEVCSRPLVNHSAPEHAAVLHVNAPTLYLSSPHMRVSAAMLRSRLSKG
jgi:hypothetical protein